MDFLGKGLSDNMKYTMHYWEFDKGNDDFAMKINRERLSRFVQGVSCLDATTFTDSDIPDDVKSMLMSRLNNDELFGTVEKYSNGYYNVMLRVYRDENLTDYYLDGFFKVWVEK